MKPHILVLLLLSAAIFASALLRASPPGQSPSTVQTPVRAAAARQLPSKHSAWATTGEFEDHTETSQEREHRQLREKFLGHLVPFETTPYSDPGFLVDGKSETIAPIFIDYVMVQKPGTENTLPELRGIPAWASDTVVIGTVLSGKSFMNSRHDNVYTDYHIQVDQILKLDKTRNIVVGQQLTASRQGGAIHFPSGHITDFYIAGRGLPKIGSQYILFLTRVAPELPEYRIAFPSGYEIANGSVYPLDDANQEYEGMSEAAFLGLVRDAIAAAKGGK